MNVRTHHMRATPMLFVQINLVATNVGVMAALLEMGVNALVSNSHFFGTQKSSTFDTYKSRTFNLGVVLLT